MSDDEWFEIFDCAGRLRGREPRWKVHAEGYWHKSAHIFLFDSNNRLYCQRRAAAKDLYANLWDYSVGEHLTPGESFHEGAQRGLHEELGIEGVDLEAIGNVQRSRNEIPASGIRDFELQQAYRGIYDGPMKLDPQEVSAVRAVALSDLERWIRQESEVFTPWFIRDLHTFGILATA